MVTSTLPICGCALRLRQVVSRRTYTSDVEAQFDRGAAWQALLSLGSDDPDADFDDDRAAELVHSLNDEGDPQVVEWALAELNDPSPWHRQAAGWVLAQHGYKLGRPFNVQVLPAVTAAAYREVDVAARCSLVRAIGYSEDPAVESDLLHFATDPEPSIREVVSQCLPSLLTEQPSEKVVAALITLTADTNPHVRDWATFAIGQQTELDSPAIREALGPASMTTKTTKTDRLRPAAKRYLPWLHATTRRPTPSCCDYSTHRSRTSAT